LIKRGDNHTIAFRKTRRRFKITEKAVVENEESGEVVMFLFLERHFNKIVVFISLLIYLAILFIVNKGFSTSFIDIILSFLFITTGFQSLLFSMPYSRETSNLLEGI